MSRITLGYRSLLFQVNPYYSIFKGFALLSPVQTDATLLDVKCCVRLHTLLHVVGCGCVLFLIAAGSAHRYTCVLPCGIDNWCVHDDSLEICFFKNTVQFRL